MTVAETTLLLWYSFMSACSLFKGNTLTLPGLLLAAPLVQLTKEVLGVPKGPPAAMPADDLVMSLLTQCQAVYARALRPSYHQGLQRSLANSSLTPAQLAACDSNMRAVLQQQVRWASAMQHIGVSILQQGILSPAAAVCTTSRPPGASICALSQSSCCLLQCNLMVLVVDNAHTSTPQLIDINNISWVHSEFIHALMRGHKPS
jgi:hypothetical protein